MSAESRSGTAARVAILVTGALAASFAPYWANWLKLCRPDVEPRWMVTPGAERFVSPLALSAVSDTEVLRDSWEDDASGRARHVDLSCWADGWLVHPATMNFLARSAAGAADSPAMVALACTSAPVVVAPALPPGAVESPVYEQHRRVLDARSNMYLLASHSARSASDGRLEGGAPAHLPAALDRLDQALGLPRHPDPFLAAREKAATAEGEYERTEQ